MRVSLTRKLGVGEHCIDNFNVNYDYGKENPILPPHAVTKNDKAHSSEIANELYATTMPIFVEALNSYHNLEFERRDWEILIGHFVQRSVRVFSNRYNGLREIINSNTVEYLKVRQLSFSGISAQSSYQAIWNFSNIEWNEQLYSFIVTRFYPHLKMITSDVKNTKSVKERSSKTIMRKSIIYLVSKFLRMFSSRKDIYISKTYFSFTDQLKLHYKLRQIPQYYYETYTPSVKTYSLKARQSIFKNSKKPKSSFEKAFVEWVILSLPKCYIEDYKGLTNQADLVKWPSQSRCIISANDFDANDLFKQWLVCKIKLNSRYIVLQHGASYGTDKLTKPSVEEQTADKFITWGWGSGDERYLVGGMQLRPYIGVRNDKKKDILLIKRAPFQKVRVSDVNYEYYQEFITQLKFIDKLHDDIRNSLHVRLQSDWKHHYFNDYQRWSAVLGTEKVDVGDNKLERVYGDYKVLIFCYESTGFLQALAGNAPAIAIWKDAFNFVMPSAAEDYLQMKKAGLILDDFEVLADFLNETDVDHWWNSEEVQGARNMFVDRYCNERSMLDVLLEVVK